MPSVPTGFLLVASPELRDPNFARTVVLTINHDAEGSYGLVLNRSLGRRLSDALPDVDERAAGIPLFQGGPVQPDVLQVLGSRPGCGRQILEGVYLAESLDALLEGAPHAQGLRGYVGYSGWGAEQLEHETAEGSWVIAPARADHVFGIPTDQLWATVLRELGGQYRWIPMQDEDPGVN